jgi:ribosomal protein S18 acetylase RimI-like enzyme
MTAGAVQRVAAGAPLPDWVTRLDRTAFGSAWKAPAEHEALWLVPPVAFARWACIPAAGEAELLRIAVDPAHRGQGLGRTLLEACQRDLAAEGLVHLHLEVRVSNAAAIRLYGTCGWTRCGLRGGYYPDGEDAALFQRLEA